MFLCNNQSNSSLYLIKYENYYFIFINYSLKLNWTNVIIQKRKSWKMWNLQRKVWVFY